MKEARTWYGSIILDRRDLVPPLQKRNTDAYTNGRMVLSNRDRMYNPVSFCINNIPNNIRKEVDIIKKKICMGIDVSKDTVDIFYNNKFYKINNNEESILAFIKKEVTNHINLLCVMESTGGYERLIAQIFMSHQMPVHIAHPTDIYYYGQFSKHFAKTDKLDALLIYKYAERIAEQEDGTTTRDENHESIVALRSLARTIEASLHGAQCRIQQMPTICSQYLQKEIQFYKTQLESIQKDIDKIINNDPDLQLKRDLMISMKGVGTKTASILLAELPELGTISHKKIACLIGVAPKTHQSGKKHSTGQIAGGRFNPRKALYMVALVSIRHNPLMKNRYTALIERGKAKKVAIVAIMREIIIILNAMLKNKKKYEVIS